MDKMNCLKTGKTDDDRGNFVKGFALFIIPLMFLPFTLHAKILKSIPLGILEYVDPQLINQCKDVFVVYKKDGKFYRFFNDPAKAQWDSSSGFYTAKNWRDDPIFYHDGVEMLYKEGGKSYMSFWDKTYGPYDRVYAPIFSMDFKHFEVEYDIGYNHYVMVNEVVYGPYEQIRFFRYAENNSSEFVFMFMKGGYAYINKTGKEYGPYPYADTAAPYPQISSDGKTFCITYHNQSEYIGNYVQVNDKKWGPYKFAYFTKFSPDGSGYTFQFTEKLEDRFLCVNGKTYPASPNDSVHFSEFNGKYCIYTYKPKGDFVFYNGKELGPYKACQNFSFSPDGSKLTFEFYTKEFEYNKKYLYNDGKIMGPYDDVYNYGYINGETPVIKEKRDKVYYAYIGDKTYGPLDRFTCVFSSDHKHYVMCYRIVSKTKTPNPTIVVLDGKVIGGFKDMDPAKFTSDGKHCYFDFQNEKDTTSVWIDGETFELVECAGMDEPIYSPDGSEYYFIYYNNMDDRFIYFGGNTFGPLMSYQIDYGFSADSKFIMASYDQKKGEVVIEEKDAPDNYPKLELNVQSAVKSKFEYTLTIEAKNSGKAPADGLTFQIFRDQGILKISYDPIPAFSLAPGESKTFVMPVKIDSKILGAEWAVFYIYIHEPNKDMDSPPQTLMFEIK